MLDDYYIQAVLDRYTKPERNCYHNKYHVINMLQGLSNLSDDGLMAAKRMELWHAVLYHDIVYVPGDKDNETLSAIEASYDLMTQGMPEKHINAVKQLIWSTIPFSDLPVEGYDEEAALLHDLDWIGFANPLTALRNDRLILEECTNYPHDPISVRKNQLSFYRRLSEEVKTRPLFRSPAFSHLNKGVPETLGVLIDDLDGI